MPGRKFLTRDEIERHSDGGRKRSWPRLRSQGSYFYNRIYPLQLSKFLLDNKYVFGEVIYTTKTTYAGETGSCGAVIRATEDRQNAILACPEQQRTGNILLTEVYMTVWT